MTKEEVLDKIGVDTGSWKHEKAIHRAMEEFAKQQAISFADHLQFNYQPCAETGYWYDHHNDPHQHWRKSSQTIYNQFIEQQNKEQ